MTDFQGSDHAPVWLDVSLDKSKLLGDRAQTLRLESKERFKLPKGVLAHLHQE